MGSNLPKHRGQRQLEGFFFITTQRDTVGYYCSSVHNLKQKDALQLKIKDPF